MLETRLIHCGVTYPVLCLTLLALLTSPQEDKGRDSHYTTTVLCSTIGPQAKTPLGPRLRYVTTTPDLVIGYTTARALSVLSALPHATLCLLNLRIRNFTTCLSFSLTIHFSLNKDKISWATFLIDMGAARSFFPVARVADRQVQPSILTS